MKTTVKKITRVHAVREDGDDEWPEVKSPFDSPSFFIRIGEITVEYDDNPAEPGGLGFTQAEVEGERFRRLKDGPKSTGFARATFSEGRAPKELRDLIRRLRWDR